MSELAWIQPGPGRGRPRRPTFDPEAERIGTLRLGQSMDKALAELGCTGEKGQGTHLEAASGDYVQTLDPGRLRPGTQDAAGPRKGGPKTVAGITARGPCTLATARGIRLGDAEEAVLAAYGRFRDSEGASEPGKTFVAGSIFGGLMFAFTDGKVSELFLGAAAE